MIKWIVWKRNICIKMGLALNNLQNLICHKTQQTNQRDKHIGSPPCKMLYTILKMEKGETKANWLKKRKLMTMHKILRTKDDIGRLCVKKWRNRTHQHEGLHRYINTKIPGGARGVMVIVVGNGHSYSSSNSGRDWLHFT